jgi:hypothetical protein
MKFLFSFLILSLSFSAMAESLLFFNEVKVENIQFLQDIKIAPGTEKTVISNVGGGFEKCYLAHNKSNTERVLSAGRIFEVTANEAMITSYSSYGNTGFARFNFKGLDSANIVYCKLDNVYIKLLTLDYVEHLLGDSLKVSTGEVKEIK